MSRRQLAATFVAAFTDGTQYRRNRSGPAVRDDRPDRRDEGIVRALGPHLGVALYDLVVAWSCASGSSAVASSPQVMAGPPGAEPLDVVELGCGTGTNAIRLAAAGARVIGVDADPEILGRARGKAGAEKVEWRSGRVEDPGLAEAYLRPRRPLAGPAPPSRPGQAGDAPGRPPPASPRGPRARRRAGPARGPADAPRLRRPATGRRPRQHREHGGRPAPRCSPRPASPASPATTASAPPPACSNFTSATVPSERR